jgi:thioesterase domain-containing protein
MSTGFDPVLPLRPAGSRVPLFCAPPISGSPYPYRALVPLLHPQQPVLALEAPGFDNDERPLDSVPALAGRFRPALQQHRAGRPVALLGWSMGGIVAYDLAGHLTAAGVPVPALILLDTPAPGTAPALSAGQAAAMMVHDIAAVGGLPRDPVAAAVPPVRTGTSPADVFAAVVRAAVLPPDCDEAFLHERFVVFAAHVHALATYRPQDRYPGRVVLIRATRSEVDTDAWRRAVIDLDEYHISGDHYTIWRGDALKSLGGVLRSVLDGDRPGASRMTSLERNS